MKFEHEDYFNFNPIEAYEPQGQLSTNEAKQKSLHEPLESAVASEPFIPFSSTSPARSDYLRASAEPFSPTKSYSKRMLPSHHAHLPHRTYSHQPRYGHHHAHQYDRPITPSSSSRYSYSSSSRKYDAYHHPATLLRDRSQSNSSSWAQVAKKDDEGQRRRSYEAPVVTVTSPEIQMYDPYSPQLLSGATKSSGTSEENVRNSQSPPLPKFFQKLCGPASSGSAGRIHHPRRDEYAPTSSHPSAATSGRAGSTQPPAPRHHHHHPGTIGGSRSRSHDRFSTTMTSTTTTKIIAQPIDKKGSFPEEIACVLDNTPSRSLEQPAKLRQHAHNLPGKLRHVNNLEAYVKDNLPSSVQNARLKRYKKTRSTTSTRHSENYHRKSPKNSKKSSFHLQPVRTNKMYQRRQSPYNNNDNQKNNTGGHSLSHSSSPSPSAHASNNTHLCSENHMNQIRTRRMHTDATKMNTVNNNNNRFWNSNTNNNSHANGNRNLRFDANNGRTMRYDNNRVNKYRHRYSKSRSPSRNFTKPHQVRYAVMCVSSLCDANKIKLSNLVCGDNVLKIAIRSSAQLENIEETMKTLIGLSGIIVEEVSVPSVETVTKRKRGFLIFMKLKNDIGVETVTELFATNGFKVNTVNNPTAETTEEHGEATTITGDETNHTSSGTVVLKEPTNSDEVSASAAILATISNLRNSISANPPSSPKAPNPTVELNPPPRRSQIQTQTMLTGTPKKMTAHKLTITVPSDLLALETEDCETDGTVNEEAEAEEPVCVPGTPLAMEYSDVMVDETTKSDESFDSVVENHDQEKPTTFSSEKMIESNEEVMVVPADPSFGLVVEKSMINYQPSPIDATLKVTTNMSPTVPPPQPHALRVPAIYQEDTLPQQQEEAKATTTTGGACDNKHHQTDENNLYSSSKRRSCNSFATFDDFDFEDSDQEPTLAFTAFEDEQKKKRKRRKRKKSKKHRPVQLEPKDISDYLPQVIGGCFAALVLAYLYN